MKRTSQQVQMVMLLFLLTSWGAAQQSLTLTGVIDNPTGASSVITAYITYVDGGPMGGSIASATVAEDGSFTLELPALSEEFLQEASIDSFCDDGGAGVRITPAQFPHATVTALLAFLETDAPSVALLASSADVFERLAAEPVAVQAGDFLVYFLYVPQEVMVEGTCLGEDGYRLHYDIQATAGWHYLHLVYEDMDGEVVGTLRASKEAPAGASWYTFSE
jgi:hypothetical protein